MSTVANVIIRTKAFRGRVFRFLETEVPDSVWTFEDEDGLRDKFWHVRPGDVVLDVGAGFGSYTLTSLVMGAARVYAFSPDPVDTALFKTNLGLNDWENSCEVLSYGLHGSPGWYSPDDAILYDSPGDGLLPVDTLGRFWADHEGLSRVEWLKMDIEGAEGYALQSGRDFLTRFRPRVLVECHMELDSDCLHDVLSVMNYLDYKSEAWAAVGVTGPVLPGVVSERGVPFERVYVYFEPKGG